MQSFCRVMIDWDKLLRLQLNDAAFDLSNGPVKDEVIFSSFP